MAPEYLRQPTTLASRESHDDDSAETETGYESGNDGEHDIAPQGGAGQPVTSLKPDSGDLSATGTPATGTPATGDSATSAAPAKSAGKNGSTGTKPAADEKSASDGDTSHMEPADTAPRLSGEPEPDTEPETDDWRSQIKQATEVERTLDQLMDTMRELDDMRLEQRRVAAMELFEGLCDVGGQIQVPTPSDLEKMSTNADRFAESQRGVQATARSVLAAIAMAPEKVAFISRYSSHRLKELTFDDPGIILAGKVRTVMEYQPGIWALGMISPFQPDQPMTIHLSDRRLSSAISTGDSILVLGYRIPVEAGDPQSLHISANVVYSIPRQE